MEEYTENEPEIWGFEKNIGSELAKFKGEGVARRNLKNMIYSHSGKKQMTGLTFLPSFSHHGLLNSNFGSEKPPKKRIKTHQFTDTGCF